MRPSHIVCIIITLLLQQSCVRTEDFGAPWSEEPMPVVFSVITIDGIPTVYLSQTYHPEMNTDSLPYPEARVSMSVGSGEWVALQRTEPQSRYFEDKAGLLKPQPGELIRLKVELNDRLLTAQTAIPGDYARILKAECILAPIKPNHSISWGGIGVLRASVKADLQLPANDGFGMFLFIKELPFAGNKEVKGERYSGVDHFVPKDSAGFTLTVQTVTPELKTFLFARTLVTSYDYEFIPELFLGAFTGLPPQYNNINGGIGLFGARYNFDFYVTIPQHD